MSQAVKGEKEASISCLPVSRLTRQLHKIACISYIYLILFNTGDTGRSREAAKEQQYNNIHELLRSTVAWETGVRNNGLHEVLDSKASCFGRSLMSPRAKEERISSHQSTRR